MSALTCPVCQGAMREDNRNGVNIDTCTRCRGVWLDRGELDKLASALGDAGGASFMPSRDGGRRRRDDDDDDDDDERRRRYGGHWGKKRRSFLDFFD